MKARFRVWGWAVGGDSSYCVAWGVLGSQVGVSTPTSSNCWVFCHPGGDSQHEHAEQALYFETPALPSASRLLRLYASLFVFLRVCPDASWVQGYSVTS